MARMSVLSVVKGLRQVTSSHWIRRSIQQVVHARTGSPSELHWWRRLLAKLMLGLAGRLCSLSILGLPTVVFLTGNNAIVHNPVMTLLSQNDLSSILDPGQIPGIKGVTRYLLLSRTSAILIPLDSQLKKLFPGHRRYRQLSTMTIRERWWQPVQKQHETAYLKQPKKATGTSRNGKHKPFSDSCRNHLNCWCLRFKLHLRSRYGSGQKLHPNVPPLPPNKSVVDVIADFLRYLLQCAASYIRDTHPNGGNLWNALKDDIDYVLSHPNGWEGKEQSQMRQAAVRAGLIPDSLDGHARVSFVTEGEASLHFAIENGVLTQIAEVAKSPFAFPCSSFDGFLWRVKGLQLLMRVEEPSTSAHIGAWIRMRGRECLRKLPCHNVST